MTKRSSLPPTTTTTSPQPAAEPGQRPHLPTAMAKLQCDRRRGRRIDPQNGDAHTDGEPQEQHHPHGPTTSSSSEDGSAEQPERTPHQFRRPRSSPQPSPSPAKLRGPNRHATTEEPAPATPPPTALTKRTDHQSHNRHARPIPQSRKPTYKAVPQNREHHRPDPRR